MRFGTSVDFNWQERHTLKEAAATIGLLDLNREVEEQRQMLHGLNLCWEQGHGILPKHLDYAHLALVRLQAILQEMAEWKLEDWGFRGVETPKPQPHNPGPLVRRLIQNRPAYTTREVSLTVGLVTDPPRFVQQMAQLRAAQVLEVDAGLRVLQVARLRMQAMESVHAALDLAQGGPDPLFEDSDA